MEIANSEIIDSLYRVHLKVIINYDFLNDEEKFVLQNILKKIQNDETLSFESKKSMFSLLDNAISDAQMNGNVSELDDKLLSKESLEYQQATTFFVAVKKEKNAEKEKVNKIYLNFFSNIYKEFSVGDTSSERAFVVKAYEILEERFGNQDVLINNRNINLKSAVENLVTLYSDLGKEYKELQQQKLEQEKVIELQNAHQLEKDKIAEQIVNKLENVSILGKLQHINYRCIASKADIINFFLQPEYNMTENDVNDIFGILSDRDIERKIFSDSDINLSDRSLDDLQRISKKLDKPLELLEKNLIQLVNNTLIAATNKRIEELKPQAGSIYKNNNELKIKEIENVEKNINYSTQNILKLEEDKKRLHENILNNLMNLPRELNSFNIKDIHNPTISNIVGKFEFKKPQFNFSSNSSIFNVKHVNGLIESIDKKSGGFVQESIKKPLIESFIKNKTVEFNSHIEEVKQKFKGEIKMFRKSYLNEYVSKKWYSFLGPLAKWVVNKFSKKFDQEFETNNSNKLNEVLSKKNTEFDEYENEVNRYVDEKLRYTEDHIKHDELLKKYNTCCVKAKNLYDQVVVINTEKEKIFNTVLQNIYHDGTYFHIADIQTFSQQITNEIKIFKNKLTELDNSLRDLKKEIDNLSDKFKKELAEDFNIFYDNFRKYKLQTTNQLTTLENTLSNATQIRETNVNLLNRNKELESEQAQLKGLKAELNSPAEKAKGKILKDLENRDSTIKKIESAVAHIASEPNLSTIISLVSKDSVNDKVKSSITAIPSSGAAGGQA